MIEFLILNTTVFFCIYLMITLALNFQQGYTGICNLGLYFPITVGALIVGYLPNRLAMILFNIDPNLDFIHNNAEVLSLLKPQLQSNALISISLIVITIVVAMAVCALLGYLVAHPALKMPATYLAVFMLCLGEGARIIGMQTDWIAGGVMGLSIINPFWWMGTYSSLGSAIFIICVTIVIFIVFYRMCNSPLGRLLKAVRENELTAECVGKNVFTIKRKVLCFSFAILGLAGVIHAFNMGAVVAGGYTRVDFSFWPWLMLIIGGAGNNLGIFVGTFSLVIMRRFMIVFKHYFAFLPFNVLWLEPIILALLLILVMVFRPAGILPEKTSRIKTTHTEG